MSKRWEKKEVLGLKIKVARLELNYYQQEDADLIGTTQGNISKIEQGISVRSLHKDYIKFLKDEGVNINV